MAKLHPASGQPSLLEQLNNALDVDADTMDRDFIASLPIRCNDMTCNPNFAHQALVDPRNAELVRETVRELKGHPWQNVWARAVRFSRKETGQRLTAQVARIAKRVQPLISGRVLAQTSPNHAYDEEYLYNDAKRIDAAFAAEDIPRCVFDLLLSTESDLRSDRYIIKMAGTGPGIKASKRLTAEGIPTLCTALFSVPQAIAASQAGMFAISMYFNPAEYTSGADKWPDVADPAVQHPMSARHAQIRAIYDKLGKETGQRQPQIKTAS